jgi:hypothetical protein
MSTQFTTFRTEYDSSLRQESQEQYVNFRIETDLIKSSIRGRVNRYKTDDLDNRELSVNTREGDYDEDIVIQQATTPQEDSVLSSDKAIIFEVLEETVRVKMSNGVMINIPKIVFSKRPEVLKYGQPIVYSVKIRPNGFRYQDFEIDGNPPENPYKSKVLETLKSIKNVR